MKKMMTGWSIVRRISCGVLALTLITGCKTTQYDGDVFTGIDVRRPFITLDATITGLASETIKDPQGNLGKVIGTGVGAIGGGVIAGSAGAGRGGTAASTGLGALIGLVIGWFIDERASKVDAFVIRITYRDGMEETVIQGKGKDRFYVGQEVEVWKQDNYRRIRPQSSQVPVIPAQ